MGDPVTIALIISVATQVGGAIVKGKAAKAQAEAIADANEFNALRAEQAGNAESSRVRRLNRRTLSTQRVQFAKAGVRMEGTPLEFLAQNAAELELNALQARIQGQNTARLEREGADVALQAGRTSAGAALLAGLSGAAGTVLSTQGIPRPTPTSTSFPRGSFTSPSTLNQA